MGTVSMALGIVSVIISALGILGSGSTNSILFMMDLLYFGVPISSVAGIILGIIASVRKMDTKQKKRARIGLLCSILGVVLWVVAWVMIVKTTNALWDIG